MSLRSMFWLGIALVCLPLMMQRGVLAQTLPGEAYIIQADDWLSRIAEKVYYDPLAFPLIVEATNDRAAIDSSFSLITNPDQIEIGQKIWIPEPATAAPTEATGEYIPLQTGNRWLYRIDHYDTVETSPITATYVMTKSVVRVESQDTATAFEVEELSQVITASVALDWLVENNAYLAGSGSPYRYWLVKSGNNIYQQLMLDFETVASEGSLLYRLPLSAGATWFPSPDQRAMFPEPDLAAGVIPGQTIISGPEQVTVPAGTFEDCFQVLTMYNGGSTFEWVCAGVGMVRAKFDHVGTPFGHHTQLLSFSKQEQ